MFAQMTSLDYFEHLNKLRSVLLSLSKDNLTVLGFACKDGKCRIEIQKDDRVASTGSNGKHEFYVDGGIIVYWNSQSIPPQPD